MPKLKTRPAHAAVTAALGMLDFEKPSVADVAKALAQTFGGGTIVPADARPKVIEAFAGTRAKLVELQRSGTLDAESGEAIGEIDRTIESIEAQTSRDANGAGESEADLATTAQAETGDQSGSRAGEAA